MPPVKRCQPVPVLTASWELLEPYQLEFKATCCAFVVATTQYFVLLVKTGAEFGSLATVRAQDASGIFAIAETSGTPGPIG